MKKHNILYICTYLDENLSNRYHLEYVSAGLKKKNSMLKALRDHNVDIIFVSMFTKFPGKIFRPGTYKSKDAKVYIPVFTTIPFMNYLINPLFTFVKILSFCKKRKIDRIIFYNCVYENVLALFFVKLLCKVKIICEYEDGWIVEDKGVKNILYLFAHKVGFFISDAVITNSSSLLEIFPKKKYMIFRGSSDHLQCNSLVTNGSKKQMINFMFASSIDEVRGVELLIDFFYQATDPGVINNSNFLITGKGQKNLTLKLEKAIQYYKSKGGKADFYGFVDEETLKTIYSKADAFLSLQKPFLRFSKYSFPSKIIEYYYYNRPIITTKTSDLNQQDFPNLIFIDYSVDDFEKILMDTIKNIEPLMKENAQNKDFLKKYHSDEIYKRAINNFLD